MRQELDSLKRDKEITVQHVQLVNETEKLNQKSEFDVKVDILGKENTFIKEERKKMLKDLRDMHISNDAALRCKTDEVERIK